MRTTHNFDIEAHLPEPHKTIYELGVANGLRVGDIVKLKKSILKVQKPTIHEEKTGKSKRLYIPVKTRKKLIYLSNESQNEYIFYSAKSQEGHITRQAVFKAFKKAAKTAGVPNNVNVATHTMRKNYAYKDFCKNKNLNKLQGKMNHHDIGETALYLI